MFVRIDFGSRAAPGGPGEAGKLENMKILMFGENGLRVVLMKGRPCARVNSPCKKPQNAYFDNTGGRCTPVWGHSRDSVTQNDVVVSLGDCEFDKTRAQAPTPLQNPVRNAATRCIALHHTWVSKGGST